ncbi:MAG: hypothetical protein HQL94_08195 [Magnetococcales bacterium]|nr:hypothetical protein [Magnetococcales bacterium]MBF0438302.1 hypothetical protein [Magnetococcales bacterium]
MTISWPADLPAVRSEGYGIALPDEILRTDMEAGVPFSRRISRSNPAVFTVSWVLTKEQFDSFWDWFLDPTTGLNAGTVWFAFSTGLPGAKATQVARFKSRPKGASMGKGIWMVSGELEVLPA